MLPSLPEVHTRTSVHPVCGRFALTAEDPSALQGRFALAPGGVPPAALGRHNVCPTEGVLAVAGTATGERRTALVRWGLLPPWARTASERVAPINARAETAAERPLFSTLVGGPNGRVLVLADGWYEWLRAEDRRRSGQPFRYSVDGGAPFAFAGLARSVRVGGERTASACILTVPANRVCAAVHDRMPAVLPDGDAEAAWLSAELDAGAALALCAPLPEDRVAAEPADAERLRPGRA